MDKQSSKKFKKNLKFWDTHNLFKVTVDAVNVVNIAGKQKRFGRSMGRRRNIRKAYVSLAAGQEINFAETK